MDLQVISSQLLNANKISAWFMQNRAMISITALAVLAISSGLYLYIKERIRAGDRGVYKELVLMAAQWLALSALSCMVILGIYYIGYQISQGNPYANAVRIVFAVILPGLFFGYLFASASNMLVRVVNTNRSWKYLHHLGISIAYFFILISIYNMFVRPVIDGLHPLFPWLGIFTGWMLAPVFISRGYADFNIRIKVEEEQTKE